ncbi:ABC transporter ATP-binding protein [Flavobacterium saliperosum]|uniref:ABC-2 type transport system ATP-binding protein n=2 Tax=Flavobacterium saliperosum TaxID=329186 RepID=A0A1G4W0Y1_9FLAO|nr:ABC transporter ATP-binding protein [Flavobacterium saliperosum]SCX14599.1 ABC-2 type transport system ATP-binding protein [Flavobacterium saliperosum]
MENAQEKIIIVENLTKQFDHFTAVKGISFHVNKGEIFGFLGANGAGKTTAMKMLIGISNSTGGTANVAGFDVHTQSEEVKQNIGYMSQKFSMYDDLTVQENITFFGGIYGLSRKQIKTKTEELIAELQLGNIAKTKVGDLPLGWKQKLAFSVALLHEPKIVFLDEPTGGVDPITRRQFWELIYAEAHKGTTIFVTTHYMDEAEYCNRVSIMVDGVIEALDTPKKLKEQFQVNSMNEVFLKLARNIE